ncbi:FAD-binding oxidoreductase [Nocardia gipuzkoensis]
MAGHTVEDLVSSLRTTPGERVVAPGDPDFDEVRRVANMRLDSIEPIAYIECTSQSSVQRVVQQAAGVGAPLAVRGGGYSVAGLGTVHGGIVVSLARLASIQVDRAAAQVRIGAGVRAGQLAAVLDPAGLSLNLPVLSAPSVIGAALSGGIGYMLRKSGFLCDSLISARIVTASGEIVEADDRKTPELMWALRGGGGNFGIVVEATFQAVPAPPLTVIQSRYALKDAAEVLAGLGQWGTALPDELTVIAMFVNGKHQQKDPTNSDKMPYLVVNTIYCGISQNLDRVLGPLHTLAPTLERLSNQTTPSQMRQMSDQHFPYDRFAVRTRSGWLGSLTPTAVDQLVEAGRALPPGHSIVEIAPLGGAVVTPMHPSSAVGRDAQFFCNAMALATKSDDEANRHQEWLESSDLPWTRADGTDRVVPGFASEDQLGNAPATYGADLSRLRDIKRRYDPSNMFRRNLNITPADHGVSS